MPSPTEVILQSKKGNRRLLRTSYVYAWNYLELRRPFHIVSHFILSVNVWSTCLRSHFKDEEMETHRDDVSKITRIETERKIWHLDSAILLQPHSTISVLTLVKSKSLRGSDCPELPGHSLHTTGTQED